MVTNNDKITMGVIITILIIFLVAVLVAVIIVAFFNHSGIFATVYVSYSMSVIE